MELIRRLDSINARDCVVTIGGFDGIHLGHQALIQRMRCAGQQLGLPTMLVTFEPLPREYLFASDPPARLTNFRERWRLLSAMGLDRLCIVTFSQRLRMLSGLQFMELLRAARARRVIVGHDFRLGRGGEANAQWCAERGAQFGFEVDVVAPVLIDDERISSGQLRQTLRANDLQRAQRLLGRPYSMRGRVRHGNRLGRTLGFPTANVAVKRRRVALSGVFAVRVHGEGLEGWPEGWPGVANLGTRPMVGGVSTLLEAHLFDYSGDLYGRELEVEFVGRLRDEATFASMDAMVQQMHRDAEQARRQLGSNRMTQ
jgi:riboflavin kinase / FMN adenylyltransferase